MFPCLMIDKDGNVITISHLHEPPPTTKVGRITALLKQEAPEIVGDERIGALVEKILDAV